MQFGRKIPMNEKVIIRATPGRSLIPSQEIKESGNGPNPLLDDAATRLVKRKMLCRKWAFSRV